MKWSARAATYGARSVPATQRPDRWWWHAAMVMRASAEGELSELRAATTGHDAAPHVMIPRGREWRERAVVRVSLAY